MHVSDANPRAKTQKKSAGKGAAVKTAAHNKKQQKSEHTRGQLLRAAEKIFTRDGFEAAKLEEIAALAGYTRGAFYANFGSKEDLFVAMVEEHIQGHIENLRKVAESWNDYAPEKRLAALREQFTCTAKDRAWAIMGLELKLFSLRHPELKTKVAAMRRRVFGAAQALIDEQLRRSHVTLPVSTSAFAIALSGIVQGLHMDRMVDQSISEQEIRKVGEIFFDCMIRKSLD